jgi:hypothetical protein
MRAASASPSAFITAAFLSCSAFITINLLRSASCWATCFSSIAFENSRPCATCVTATSSSEMSNWAARFVIASRMSFETLSRSVKRLAASWRA